jgi:hypothetical protein
MAKRPKRTNDKNPDPITGEPGSHPVGTGVGAAHEAGRRAIKIRPSRGKGPSKPCGMLGSG